VENLACEIEGVVVPAGSVAAWWLAQAGFALKSAAGTVIYVDPYLSNLAERTGGFRRLTLAPIGAEEVRAHWLVSSHEHADHLDADALPVIARNNPGCRFAGSAACAPVYRECGLPTARQLIMEAGGTYDLDGVSVHTARADHGEYSPSALALVLDFGGVSVMFTGDTALTTDLLQPLIARHPQVLVPCINGSFGNLNAVEAAQLTALIKPRLVIPCHFWMFKEHHVAGNGDPLTFVNACEQLCSSVRVEVLTPGQGIVVTPQVVQAIA